MEDIAVAIGEFFCALVHWIQKHVFGVKPVNGNEAFIGQSVTVSVIDANGACYVMIDGERWKLACEDNLSVGDKAKITDVQGLCLVGERLKA